MLFFFIFLETLTSFWYLSKNVCPAVDPGIRTKRWKNFPGSSANKNTTSTTPEWQGHSQGSGHGYTWHTRLLKATCANMHLSLSAVRLCLSSFSFFKLWQSHQCCFINKQTFDCVHITHTHTQQGGEREKEKEGERERARGFMGFIGFKVKHYCILWEDTRTHAYQAGRHFNLFQL